MKYVLYFLTLFLLGAFFACSKDDDGNEPLCDTAGITYNNFAASIFNNNCVNAGCHASGEPQGSLSTYDEASNFPFEDKMISALRHENGFSKMPKNGDQLDDCTIDKLAAWLNAGKPE